MILCELWWAWSFLRKELLELYASSSTFDQSVVCQKWAMCWSTQPVHMNSWEGLLVSNSSYNKCDLTVGENFLRFCWAFLMQPISLHKYNDETISVWEYPGSTRLQHILCICIHKQVHLCFGNIGCLWSRIDSRDRSLDNAFGKDIALTNIMCKMWFRSAANISKMFVYSCSVFNMFGFFFYLSCCNWPKTCKIFCRILSCFKLNAFEYLNLPFDSSLEDVKKQYRKVIISPPLELIEGFSQQFESLLVGRWLTCSYSFAIEVIFVGSSWQMQASTS